MGKLGVKRFVLALLATVIAGAVLAPGAEVAAQDGVPTLRVVLDEVPDFDELVFLDSCPSRRIVFTPADFTGGVATEMLRFAHGRSMCSVTLESAPDGWRLTSPFDRTSLYGLDPIVEFRLERLDGDAGKLQLEVLGQVPGSGVTFPLITWQCDGAEPVEARFGFEGFDGKILRNLTSPKREGFGPSDVMLVSLVRTEAHLAGATCEASFTDSAGFLGASSGDVVIPKGGAAKIRLTLRHAPDEVFRCAGRDATMVGTVGNDVLVGTPGPDVIVADKGNDMVRGLGGDDIICTGNGDDRVVAGPGKDLLKGGKGDDRLNGGPGRDRVDGGRGDDTCRAERVRRCE